MSKYQFYYIVSLLWLVVANQYVGMAALLALTIGVGNAIVAGLAMLAERNKEAGSNG